MSSETRQLDASLKPDQSPEVFYTKVGKHTLVTSPLAGFSALVNNAAATHYARLPLENMLADIAPRPDLNFVRLEGKSGRFIPSMLGIIPTRGCNIGCSYCNFGGPDAKLVHMKPEVAIAAVDFVADNLQRAKKEKMRVHFFGGEPFASKDIIDCVIHRTRQICAEKNLTPYFDVSTNGVFSEEYAKFVGDYFDAVVLSFDGYKKYHDKSRPGKSGKSTFDRVLKTARILNKADSRLFLRVCITSESVGDMVEMTRWLINDIRPQGINFESLTPGLLAQESGLSVPNPHEFARNFIESSRLASENGVKTVYAATEADGPRNSFCPVGTDSFIVTPDNRISACYLQPEEWEKRGMDLSIGDIDETALVQLDHESIYRVRAVPAEKPRCANCFCKYCCSGGCHVNQTFPGSDTCYTDFCKQTRIITASLILEQLGFRDKVDRLMASEDYLSLLNSS